MNVRTTLYWRRSPGRVPRTPDSWEITANPGVRCALPGLQILCWTPPTTKKATRKGGLFDTTWWAVQGSNLRPLPCEGNALPLS